jgi:hypothetical protein
MFNEFSCLLTTNSEVNFEYAHRLRDAAGVNYFPATEQIFLFLLGGITVLKVPSERPYTVFAVGPGRKIPAG